MEGLAGVALGAGVRYAYKYLARIAHNRGFRTGDEVDVAALGNIPTTPHQSRGKKLLSMTEVNERFPLLMAKNWITARVSDGRSTNGDGGITASSNQYEHFKEAGLVAPALVQTTDDMVDKHEIILRTEYAKDDTQDDDTGDEYSSPIATVELFAEPYDSCAICISTLGQGDGIRSLTCGHVFHATCLDPWLTLRRASCPLCKLDLYIPKSNAAGSEHPEQRGAIL